MNISPLESFDLDAPKQPLAIVTKCGIGTMVVHFNTSLRDPHKWDSLYGSNQSECEDIWQKLAGAKKLTNNGKSVQRLYAVYTSHSLREIALTGDPRHWTTKTWNHRPVTITHDGRPTCSKSGVTVRKIGDSLNINDPIEAMEDLRERLWSEGIDIKGSISSMSFKLYRRTLTAPEFLYMEKDAYELFSKHKHSARIGAKSGRYYDCEYHDIRTAFPWEMFANEYPAITSWKPGHKVTPNTNAVLADVIVRKGHDDWYPLPFHDNQAGRACIYGPNRKWRRGLWSPREIEITRELGNSVRVIGTIETTKTIRFRKEWWEQVTRLRNPGPSSSIGKSLTTALWGRFAMGSEESQSHRYTDSHADNETSTEPIPAQPLIFPTIGVAFSLLARMRTRLWDEAISKCEVIYCATDGVIIQSGAIPQPWDTLAGNWAVKHRMNQIIIKAPFHYAYQPIGASKGWIEYVVSGARSREGKVSRFNQMADHGSVVLTGFGNFFPTMEVEEMDALLTGIDYIPKRRSISEYLSLRETFSGICQFVSSRRTDRESSISEINFGGIANDRPIPVRSTTPKQSQQSFPLESSKG